MSCYRRNMLFCKRLAKSMTLLLSSFILGGALVSCVENSGPRYEETDWNGMHPASGDPLPGDLVKKTLMEDSLKVAKGDLVKKNMAKVISDYRKHFKGDIFNGYFLTDFNEDGLPELWIKVGSSRDKSKLELYYPLADGSLQKSDTSAEPGKYYLGEDYMIQVVGAGPNRININKIKIHNGSMDVEVVKDIDLYNDPTLSVPQFKEKQVHHTSLANLNPLYNAFK